MEGYSLIILVAIASPVLFGRAHRTLPDLALVCYAIGNGD